MLKRYLLDELKLFKCILLLAVFSLYLTSCILKLVAFEFHVKFYFIIFFLVHIIQKKGKDISVICIEYFTIFFLVVSSGNFSLGLCFSFLWCCVII